MAESISQPITPPASSITPPMQQQQPNNGKSRSTVWTIVWLILFFPLGLYFVWTNGAWSKKKKQIFTGAWALLVVFGLISNASGGTNTTIQQNTTQPMQSQSVETPQPTKDSSQKDLNATIKFSNDALMLVNNDSVDWKGCKLEVNSSGLFSSGWVNRQDVIVAKDSTIIPFREFTKDDGARFDNNTTKFQNLSISCSDAGDGKRGFGYFGAK